jgi:hypothetical protein
MLMLVKDLFYKRGNMNGRAKVFHMKPVISIVEKDFSLCTKLELEWSGKIDHNCEG